MTTTTTAPSSNLSLQSKLETAYLVTDYYKALMHHKKLPTSCFPKLEEALQCHRLLREYINKKNLSIKEGLRLVNSALTDDQIVWTWQQVQTKAKFAPGYKITARQ